MYSFFFFNDTATTEIYTLSLHDALPISRRKRVHQRRPSRGLGDRPVLVVDLDLGHPPLRGEGLQLVAPQPWLDQVDRKSTRLNSSHANISYAVFCLKKKKTRRAHDRLIN